MALENGRERKEEEEQVELRALRRTRFHVNRVDSMEGRASLLGEQETRKSLRHMTREALPRLDNYRNILSIQAAHRPSLDELHNPTLDKVTTTPLIYICLIRGPAQQQAGNKKERRISSTGVER